MSCLWMGDLDPYMDETFVKNAFMALGLKVITVKVIRNKITGAFSCAMFSFHNVKVIKKKRFKRALKLMMLMETIEKQFKRKKSKKALFSFSSSSSSSQSESSSLSSGQSERVNISSDKLMKEKQGNEKVESWLKENRQAKTDCLSSNDESFQIKENKERDSVKLVNNTSSNNIIKDQSNYSPNFIEKSPNQCQSLETECTLSASSVRDRDENLMEDNAIYLSERRKLEDPKRRNTLNELHNLSKDSEKEDLTVIVEQNKYYEAGCSAVTESIQNKHVMSDMNKILCSSKISGQSTRSLGKELATFDDSKQSFTESSKAEAGKDVANIEGRDLIEESDITTQTDETDKVNMGNFNDDNQIPSDKSSSNGIPLINETNRNFDIMKSEEKLAEKLLTLFESKFKQSTPENDINKEKKAETLLIDESTTCTANKIKTKTPIKLTLKVNGSNKAITPKSAIEKSKISNEIKETRHKESSRLTLNNNCNEKLRDKNEKRSIPMNQKEKSGFWDKIRYNCIKKSNERYLYEQKKKDGLRARFYKERIKNDDNSHKRRQVNYGEDESSQEDLLLTKFNSYTDYCNYYLKKYFIDLEKRIGNFLMEQSSIRSNNLIYLTETDYINSEDFFVNDLSQLLINQMDEFTRSDDYYYVDSLMFYLTTKWRNDTWVTPKFLHSQNIWYNLFKLYEGEAESEDKLKPPGEERYDQMNSFRESMGYCFVDFASSEVAQHTMLKYNGKIVPTSKPPRRFKLNYANYGKDGANNGQGYSVFVGDLTEDVDDLLLYSTFSKRYPSCRLAKVVLNEEGHSRGYGFVRFEDQDEQKRAMIEMQGHRGLGGKPIRVSPAQHKKATTTKPNVSSQEQQWIQQQEEQQAAFTNSMAEQYVQMWHKHYGTDPNYVSSITGKQSGGDQSIDPSNSYAFDPAQAYNQEAYSYPPPPQMPPQEDFEEDEFVDPGLEVDVDKLNEAYMKSHSVFQEMMHNARCLYLSDKETKTLDSGQLRSIFA
ncbi:DgyrCDS576 [Dimorphilus gyrociliatus]|uniref:tRNA selenocysteine-associated protein 1 n=1 Tax=Dimorphilus gyrociliatus TaxID=2664684 RepID=A0A7I8V534_9ANNE|nr:DgyrCDS576 [Dimorphilus gyrociliatus]